MGTTKNVQQFMIGTVENRLYPPPNEQSRNPAMSGASYQFPLCRSV